MSVTATEILYIKNFNMDDATPKLVMSMNCESTSYRHTLTLSATTSAYQYSLQVNNIYASKVGVSEWTYDLTNYVADMYNLIPSATSVQFTAVLATSGTSTTSTGYCTGYVTEENSAPTIGTFGTPTETNSAVTALGLAPNLFIKGKSGITVAVSGFAANHKATISKMTLEVGGVTKTLTDNGTVTFSVLPNAGILQANYTIVDSRGFSKSGGYVWLYQGWNYSVLDYDPIAIQSFSVERTSGTNVNVSLSGFVENVNITGNDIQSLSYQLKSPASTTWTTAVALTGFTSGTESFEYTGIITLPSSSNAYDIKITATDKLSSHSIITSVGVIDPHVCFRSDKIMVGRDVIPTATDGYNLGSSSAYFNNVYANNINLKNGIATATNFGGATWQRVVAEVDGTRTLKIAVDFDTNTSGTTGGFAWANVGAIEYYLGLNGNAATFNHIYSVSVGAIFTNSNGVAYIGACTTYPVGGYVIPNIYVARGNNANIVGTVYITINGD